MSDNLDRFRNEMSNLKAPPSKTKEEIEAKNKQSFHLFFEEIGKMDDIVKQSGPNLFVRLVVQETNTGTGVTRSTITCGNGTDLWLAFDANIKSDQLKFSGVDNKYFQRDLYSAGEAGIAVKDVARCILDKIKLKISPSW